MAQTILLSRPRSLESIIESLEILDYRLSVISCTMASIVPSDPNRMEMGDYTCTVPLSTIDYTRMDPTIVNRVPQPDAYQRAQLARVLKSSIDPEMKIKVILMWVKYWSCALVLVKSNVQHELNYHHRCTANRDELGIARMDHWWMQANERDARALLRGATQRVAQAKRNIKKSKIVNR